MIVDKIQRPQDYFHFSIMCKALWEKLRSPEKWYALDASLFRRRLERSMEGRSWADMLPRWNDFLQNHPNGVILSWLIRTHQPVDVVRRAIEVYREVFPVMFMNEPGFYLQPPTYIHPLRFYVFECNHMEIFQLLLDMGIERPLEETGEGVMWEAAAFAPSIDPPLWLSARGAPVHHYIIFTLEERGLLRRNTPEYATFEALVRPDTL